MTPSTRSTDLLTTSQVITADRNRLNTISLFGDGVNPATLIIYDNPTSASGKVIAKAIVTAADPQIHVIWSQSVIAKTGIYASVTGTGASYIVYFGG